MVHVVLKSYADKATLRNKNRLSGHKGGFRTDRVLYRNDHWSDLEGYQKSF